jgi:thioredoxin 1
MLTTLAVKLPELTDATLPQFLHDGGTPTVLVFHSPASKPARTVIPVVEELARDYDGLVRFALVNTQAASDALDSYGVLSLPTFLFFRGGRMTDRFIGLLTREKFEEKIEENLRRV